MPKKITNVSKKILDAAKQIYHEEGMEHISIRRIAEISGLAVGTVYNRFDDKEALLAQILAGDIEQIRISVMEGVFGKPPKEALYTAMYTFIAKTMEESHDIIRYVIDMRSSQEYVERILSGACNQIRELVEELIISVYLEHGVSLSAVQAGMLSDMALSMMQVASRHGQDGADARAALVFGMVVSHAKNEEAWGMEKQPAKKGLFKRGRRDSQKVIQKR